MNAAGNLYDVFKTTFTFRVCMEIKAISCLLQMPDSRGEPEGNDMIKVGSRFPEGAIVSNYFNTHAFLNCSWSSFT